MSVYRIYVEKKEEYAVEAKGVLSEINTLLGIKDVTNLRILNRYDVEGIDNSLFEVCKKTIFSEPQLDDIYEHIPSKDCTIFASEYLPGQFDQRADSAAQCIQIVSKGEKPIVRTAKIFLLYGDVTCEELETIKKYMINPVESREAKLSRVDTLKIDYKIPTSVEILDGFIDKTSDELKIFIQENGLAMDLDDILFCQKYFISENRNPTITEIKMIDTYWSDHCRHTTFSTILDDVQIDSKSVKEVYENYLSIRNELYVGKNKPLCLMDMAVIGAKYLKSKGKLPELDESEEINACSIKMDVDVNGKIEKWLFMFKNETHNHPTEIEPFGGAATCIGGAIRDPLSGRSYVYGAMRVTGAGNPLVSVEDTIKGKLPQKKIVTTAANGYSSYGNQIGLATGLVDEIYHEGYIAKRMEIGAVVGATPIENVRREVPLAGDIIVLLGGQTGRDGCGGATGSSKSHSLESLENCGAEVQKGNAPVERKLQRLFRDKSVTKMIKRCNDFGAGGVSVAIGELADGLIINLDAVPKKYDGLDGTELAISESQERMAVVLEKENVELFLKKAHDENLEATVVATVTEEARLVMNWNGKTICDINREFLNSNGAEKHAQAKILKTKLEDRKIENTAKENFEKILGDLNVCSKKGLSERFDSTIGAGTVLMPFGGKNQLTPIQSMVQKIPVLYNETKTCSAMAYGFNPFISKQNPFLGAYYAVVESISKIVATGFSKKGAYLTFQEYFEKLQKDATRWGKPVSALLGALKAQLDFEIAAIGGKDSMSGSFENIDVPPTLTSFAVSIGNTDNVISPEFKAPNHKVRLVTPIVNEDGTLDANRFNEILKLVEKLIKDKKVVSAWTPTYGGVAEGLFKMAIGNNIGFKLANNFDEKRLYQYNYGSFVLEMNCEDEVGELLGETISTEQIIIKDEILPLENLIGIYEAKLEKVFPYYSVKTNDDVKAYKFDKSTTVKPKIQIAKPKVLIPVFPGTNCEYDTANALKKAGAEAEIVVIKNLKPQDISESVDYIAKVIKNSQMVAVNL